MKKKYVIKTKKTNIYFDGKNHKLDAPLDINNSIKKQVFYKHKKKNTPKKIPCLKCEYNKQGYCEKYHQWCSSCYYKCVPNGKPNNTYGYKDKNQKKHYISY